MLELIKHWCHTCKKVRDFEYTDSQYIRGRRVFDIYNCEICGDSIVENLSDEWKGVLVERVENRKIISSSN